MGLHEVLLVRLAFGTFPSRPAYRQTYIPTYNRRRRYSIWFLPYLHNLGNEPRKRKVPVISAYSSLNVGKGSKRNGFTEVDLPFLAARASSVRLVDVRSMDVPTYLLFCCAILIWEVAVYIDDRQ